MNPEEENLWHEIDLQTRWNKLFSDLLRADEITDYNDWCVCDAVRPRFEAFWRAEGFNPTRFLIREEFIEEITGDVELH